MIEKQELVDVYTANRIKTGKDWCVPSLNELIVLYKSNSSIGNFSTSSGYLYWSSSEHDRDSAYGLNFSTGSYSSNYIKTSTSLRVRCIYFI